MLFRVAGGTQRNGVPIVWFLAYPAISSCPYMRGLRWRHCAEGYAGKLTDKSQVRHPPVRVRLGLVARYAARDASDRHQSELRRRVRVRTHRHLDCESCVQHVRSRENLVASSRGDLETGTQRGLQRQFPLRDRHLIRSADLFHHALDKIVEHLQLAIEGPRVCNQASFSEEMRPLVCPKRRPLGGRLPTSPSSRRLIAFLSSARVSR